MTFAEDGLQAVFRLLCLTNRQALWTPEAEYDVFQYFRRLASGPTAILIIRPFSTIRMADRIFGLKQGSLIGG